MIPHRAIALWLMIFLGLFSAAFCGVMLITMAQERSSGILTTPELTQLKDRLAKTPKDENLKKEIRTKDQQLRQEYMLNRARFKTGSWLLILALAGWFASAHWFGALTPLRSPEEILAAPAHPYQPRQGALAVGAVTALLFLVLATYALFGRGTIPSAAQVAQLAKQAGGQAAKQVAALGAAPKKSTTPLPAQSTAAVKDASPFKDNWPCFRGPDNLGVAGPGKFPTAWNAAAKQGITWQTEVVLEGKSSPILWGGRLFLTGADAKQQHVACFDRKTGKLLWNAKVTAPGPAAEVQSFDSTGFAAPTPATDSLRVYAMFASGTLAAFDFDGHQVWAKSLGAPESTYGFATSLLVYENTLILQFDQGSDAEAKKSKLLGLDPATGTVRWSVARPVPNSWSSPALIRTPARVELVTCAAPWVIAYDPVKGTELWRVTGLDGDVAPSPTFGGGLLFVTNDRAKLMAIRPGGSGDVTAKNIVWSSDKGMPDIASPVTDGKRLFQVAAGGSAITCHSADKGAFLWEQNNATAVSASPILAGGLLYVTGEDGVTQVVEPGDKFKALAKGEVGEPVSATPAFADGQIYIRGSKHLFCVGAPVK